MDLVSHVFWPVDGNWASSRVVLVGMGSQLHDAVGGEVTRAPGLGAAGVLYK